jgi:hypothetical protein
MATRIQLVVAIIVAIINIIIIVVFSIFAPCARGPLAARLTHRRTSTRLTCAATTTAATRARSTAATANTTTSRRMATTTPGGCGWLGGLAVRLLSCIFLISYMLAITATQHTIARQARRDVETIAGAHLVSEVHRVVFVIVLGPLLLRISNLASRFFVLIYNHEQIWPRHHEVHEWRQPATMVQGLVSARSGVF